jgi:hypothetical protein
MKREKEQTDVQVLAMPCGLCGQAAVEVLSYAAFFLLVFIGSVAVFLQMQNQDIVRAEYSYAQQIANRIADQVHVAVVAGNGFVQAVSIPNSLLGKEYNITISRPNLASPAAVETGFVYIEWVASNGRLASVSAPTITSSYDVVTWAPKITLNATTNSIIVRSDVGRINMTNINGTIKISKA